MLFLILYPLFSNIYVNSATGFIGINASGKTSVLKVILLALEILNNEPINHVDSRCILLGTEKATITTYFYDNRKYICCLETVITAKTENFIYSILSEKMWEKPLSSVKSKKYLTDFTGLEPIKIRKSDEEFLPDDVKNDPAFYPSQETIENLEVYDNLGEQWLGIYNDLYLQFKMYRK